MYSKIQQLFMIMILSKLRIEGNSVNFRKNIHKIPTANVILHGEKLEVFPLRSGTRQDDPSPPLFNTILEVLANAMRHKK